MTEKEKMRVFIIFLIGCLVFASCKERRIKLHVIFDNADGLYKGSSVISRGLIIGDVGNLSLNENGVLATLLIKEKYRPPVGSSFELTFENLIARSNMIEVIFSKSGELYQNNDTVIVHNEGHTGRILNPIRLDSSSREEILNFFRKIDTLLTIKK